MDQDGYRRTIPDWDMPDDDFDPDSVLQFAEPAQTVLRSATKRPSDD